MRIQIRFLQSMCIRMSIRKSWKDIAKHIEDIPSGFLSYLNLKQSEFGLEEESAWKCKCITAI